MKRKREKKFCESFEREKIKNLVTMFRLGPETNAETEREYKDRERERQTERKYKKKEKIPRRDKSTYQLKIYKSYKLLKTAISCNVIIACSQRPDKIKSGSMIFNP